jgi:hypothetical protein
MDGPFGALPMIEDFILYANFGASDHRDFCSAMQDISFDQMFGSKWQRDDPFVDRILWAAFGIHDPLKRVSLLRHTSSRRQYFDHWHRLRDFTYTELLKTQGQQIASRKLAGLFGEVNNVVAGSKRELVPRYSGPRFFARMPGLSNH